MICENCGKEHDGSYGSGRFCCKECARSFSTKNESHTLKEAKCIDCGQYFMVGKRASLNKCRCEDCHKKYKNYHKPSCVKKCKICGKTYYKYQGGCQNEFCKQHSIQGFELLKIFGFDKSKLGTFEVENEFDRIRNIIYKLYWEDNLSSKEISEKFNFKSKHSITQTVFKFLNIPCRNVGQSISNAFLTGRKNTSNSKNQYKSEWHTTWNGKEVYLRSSYESDYAKELDEQKIDYDVEALRIKYFDTKENEYRCAIPDFYIPSENMIVEIKSSWTLDKQEMKDKMKTYKELGYNFKLICDHKEINNAEFI